MCDSAASRRIGKMVSFLELHTAHAHPIVTTGSQATTSKVPALVRPMLNCVVGEEEWCAFDKKWKMFQDGRRYEYRHPGGSIQSWKPV